MIKSCSQTKFCQQFRKQLEINYSVNNDIFGLITNANNCKFLRTLNMSGYLKDFELILLSLL